MFLWPPFWQRRDIDRYVYSMCGDKRPGIESILLIAASPGLWTQAYFWLTHHFLYRFQPRALGKIPSAPAFVMSRAIAPIAGIEIESGAHIGCGLLINSFGGIVLGAVTVGENCTINQGVTLGRSSMVAGKALHDLPTMGDRVFIGPGAIVAGPVALGDDASVAGGSLVTRDVPAYGTAMGVPASITVAVSRSVTALQPSVLLDSHGLATCRHPLPVGRVQSASAARRAE